MVWRSRQGQALDSLAQAACELAHALSPKLVYQRRVFLHELPKTAASLQVQPPLLA